MASITPGVATLLQKVSSEVKDELLAGLADGFKQAIELAQHVQEDTVAESQRLLELKDRQVETTKRRVVGTAELAARNLSLQLVEEAVQRAFQEALRRFRERAPPARYPASLEKLLDEAVDMVGGKEFVASANAPDAAFLERACKAVAKRRRVKISVDKEFLDCVGGLRLRTADGSVIFDNTFEARLERMKPILRKRLADIFLKGG